VTYGSVTTDASDIAPVFARGADALNNFRVAFQACRLGHSKVALRDNDFVGEPATREGKRVKEAVNRFRRVLRNQSGRRMAIVADGNLAVARFHPAAQVLSHHMAIGARLWVVAEVGRALRITECIETDAEKGSHGNAEKDCSSRAAPLTSNIASHRLKWQLACQNVSVTLVLRICFIGSLTTAAVWPQAAPPTFKIGDINVRGSLLSRFESWNWFEARPDDQNAYSYSGNVLKLNLQSGTERLEWQVELEAPLLTGLPARATAPAPQPQLGLGANYYAANVALDRERLAPSHRRLHLGDYIVD